MRSSYVWHHKNMQVLVCSRTWKWVSPALIAIQSPNLSMFSFNIFWIFRQKGLINFASCSWFDCNQCIKSSIIQRNMVNTSFSFTSQMLELKLLHKLFSKMSHFKKLLNYVWLHWLDGFSRNQSYAPTLCPVGVFIFLSNSFTMDVLIAFHRAIFKASPMNLAHFILACKCRAQIYVLNTRISFAFPAPTPSVCQTWKCTHYPAQFVGYAEVSQETTLKFPHSSIVRRQML